MGNEFLEGLFWLSATTEQGEESIQAAGEMVNKTFHGVKNGIKDSLEEAEQQVTAREMQQAEQLGCSIEDVRRMNEQEAALARRQVVKQVVNNRYTRSAVTALTICLAAAILVGSYVLIICVVIAFLIVSFGGAVN